MKRTAGSWLRTIGTGLLIITGAVPMFMTGLEKFRSPIWRRMFERWGYPDQFYLVIGAIEVVAALALLLPRTRLAASLTLLVVMAGAFVTHAMHGEARFTSPLVFMVVYSAIAFLTWRRQTRASGSAAPAAAAAMPPPRAQDRTSRSDGAHTSVPVS